MKKIPIRTGETIIVDNEDYEKVMQHRWNFSKTSRYVRGTVNKKNCALHRFILNPSSNQCVDHINGNPLDNRKENLRICSHAQNMRNRKINENNTSGYKGVDKMKNGRFRAKIGKDGKRFNLGVYETPELAAAAYNGGALILFKEYANLNSIKESPKIKKKKISRRGEESGFHKLTNKEVLEIRQLNLPYVEIAKMYGVHPTTISLIVRRKAWTHLIDNTRKGED